MPTVTKIDPVQAYKLRAINKLTYAEIGQYFGTSKSSVIESLQRLSALVHSPAQHEEYQSIKAYLLGSVEQVLLASLTDPEKLQKASLNNVAYTYSQVANQLRLERGESTANLGVLGKLILQTHSELGQDRRVRQAAEASDQPAAPLGNDVTPRHDDGSGECDSVSPTESP